MADLTCPKCNGPRDEKSLYCPFCGSIFSRIENGGSAPRSSGSFFESQASAPPPPPPPPEPRYGGTMYGEAPAEQGTMYGDVPPAEQGTMYGGTMYGAAPAGAAVNPYQAPGATLYGPRPREVESWPAGRLHRLAAAIVDGLALVGAMMFFIFLNSESFSDESLEQMAEEDVLSMLAIFVVPIALVGLINIALLARNGQTIGKLLLRIRIVRTSGEKAGVLRILFMRMMVPGMLSNIPLVGPIFGLIDTLYIFRDDRRCIHDHIADTMVVTT